MMVLLLLSKFLTVGPIILKTLDRAATAKLLPRILNFIRISRQTIAKGVFSFKIPKEMAKFA